MARGYRARNPDAEAQTMLTTFASSQTSRAAALPDDMQPWVLALTCWLVVGLAAVICIPELRGSSPLFGWLPFWLIVAPAIDLAVLRRRNLITRAQELLARVGRRRRTARQASPSRRRSRTARHAQPLARKVRAGMASRGLSAPR
jgi:hypothetical protein